VQKTARIIEHSTVLYLPKFFLVDVLVTCFRLERSAHMSYSLHASVRACVRSR